MFGPFTISERGLRTSRNELVPWTRLSRIQVHEGTFSVVKNGEKRPFESCRVSRIPNYVLFVTLTRRLLAAGAKG